MQGFFINNPVNGGLNTQNFVAPGDFGPRMSEAFCKIPSKFGALR